MFDKRTVKLLKYVARTCEDGSFKVIEMADLAKSISSRVDPESVRPVLKFLADNEMIDIKYSDETKYCLTVLPKGRVYIEMQNGKSKDIALSRRLARFIIIGSFLAAFAGAAAACILIKYLPG